MAQTKSGERYIYWDKSTKSWLVRVRIRKVLRTLKGRFAKRSEAIALRDAYLRGERVVILAKQSNTGLKYVYRTPQGFEVKVKGPDGKMVNGGTFKSEFEARKARNALIRKLRKQ